MRNKKMLLPTTLLWLAGSLAAVASAGAHQKPSSDLLLPYFEVELAEDGVTTRFSVVNSAAEDVDVKISLYSNWGLEVSKAAFTLAGGELLRVDLRDWVLDGKRPAGNALDAGETAELQALLTAQPSPRDGLYQSGEYYSGERFYSLAYASGSVRIRARGKEQPAILLGDYYILDPQEESARGDVLVDVAERKACSNLCKHHALRFQAGESLDFASTELIVWADRSVKPADSTEVGAGSRVAAEITVYEEDGTAHSASLKADTPGFLPLDLLKVSDLGLDVESGWLRIDTEEETYVSARFAGENPNFHGVALESFCLEAGADDPDGGSGGGSESERASLRLDKRTNGKDGSKIKKGDGIEWTYLVVNTGNVPVHNLQVSDDREGSISCGKDSLQPGEKMTCSKRGIAQEGPYKNVGTVTGLSPAGEEVRASDPSDYTGVDPGIDPTEKPVLEIEKKTNGQDADQPPGLTIPVGAYVRWDYFVTNTGKVKVTGVKIVDDQEGLICEQASLAPGERMSCSRTGIAGEGSYKNVATVTGAAGPFAANDDTASHYRGQLTPPPPGVPSPFIHMETATNGQDADQPTGPVLMAGDPVSWSYVVTNTSGVDLHTVQVTDDRLGAITCPKSTLKIGESMTCHAGAGTAQAGQYSNLGTVTALADGPSDIMVSDSDPSHYFGQLAAIDLEKSTNGWDADDGPGPKLDAGDTVLWTYEVRNTGNVDLYDVSVTDDREGAICTVAHLAPGQSAVCERSGVAVEGAYSNLGTATGTTGNGLRVSGTDRSHYQGERPPAPGRMTGGGSVFGGGEKFSHGFELHCDASPPNNLEINWGKGKGKGDKGQSFHLTALHSGACSDDPTISEGSPVAGFDTFAGSGVGRLNGEDAATITFRFTDAGEPGKSDLAELTITPPGGGAAIVVSGLLQSGNHQAHAGN